MIGYIEQEYLPVRVDLSGKEITKVVVSPEWTQDERTHLARLMNRDLETAIVEKARMKPAESSGQTIMQKMVLVLTVFELKDMIDLLWNLDSEELEANRNLFHEYLA